MVKYKIAAGNIGGAYAIDRTLGIISVAKELDMRSVENYNLVVTATDGGTPSLASSVNVHIEVRTPSRGKKQILSDDRRLPANFHLKRNKFEYAQAPRNCFHR